MKTFKRVIRYLAIAFAFSLILGIAVGIYELCGFLINLASGNHEGFQFHVSLGFGEEIELYEEHKELDVKNGVPSHLNVELHGTSLTIKTGDAFTVTTNHPQIDVREEKGTLTLCESIGVAARYTGTPELILTIPNSHSFDTVEIESGAGRWKVENLQTSKLFLDLGAGEVIFEALYVTEYAEISGGAGHFSVKSGSITNLDLDIGVGETVLCAALLGDCEVNCGIGSTEIILCGDREQYTVTLDKGIGEVVVDGATVSDGASIGSGEHRLDIDGGIGKVSVRFLPESEEENT